MMSDDQTTAGLAGVSAAMSTRPRRISITEPETVKALFDNRQRAMLAPFFAGPTTITEAADLTSSLPTTMLYFVRRMVKSGALIHVDEVRRSGKLVKRFCTAADELFMPIEAAEDVLLVPQRRYQSLFNEALSDEIVRHHYEVAPTGALVRLVENGAVQLTGAVGKGDWLPGENGPRVLFEWTMLRLRSEDAIALQQELHELMQKYRTLPFGDQDFYLGVNFAPVPATHGPNNLRQFGNTPVDFREA
jgi:hypothetical protein